MSNVKLFELKALEGFRFYIDSKPSELNTQSLHGQPVIHQNSHYKKGSSAVAIQFLKGI